MHQNNEKKKWPWEMAMPVAEEIVDLLKPCCERIAIAGSLRRLKRQVGDIEILLIPKFKESVRTDMFAAPDKLNLADLVLQQLIAEGVIAKRKNVNGSEVWGDKNKLAVHVTSSIPVDFFSTTSDCWFNYLVCRTGSAESNIRIATAAKAKGWKWNPYGAGFTDGQGELVRVGSEREVFTFCGLPYLNPKDR